MEVKNDCYSIVKIRTVQYRTYDIHMYDYRLVYLINKNFIHTVYVNPSIHMWGHERYINFFVLKIWSNINNSQQFNRFQLIKSIHQKKKRKIIFHTKYRVSIGSQRKTSFDLCISINFPASLDINLSNESFRLKKIRTGSNVCLLWRDSFLLGRPTSRTSVIRLHDQRWFRKFYRCDDRWIIIDESLDRRTSSIVLVIPI